MRLFTFAACLVMFFNSVSIAQVPPPGRRDTARNLIIQLNNNYLLLDRELKELEGDMRDFPKTTLSLSAVNKMREGDVRLVSIEVQDNARLLESHLYSAIENEALAAGGRHQMYQGETREGKHVLKVIYYWTGGDAPPQRGETYITFSISKGMTYFIELFLKKSGGNMSLDSSQFEFRGR